MKFWRSMTIAEMDRLLELKDGQGWKDLSNILAEKRDKSKSRPSQSKLADWPQSPAVYFFFCVRESARRQGETVEIKTSDAAALLPPLSSDTDGNSRQLEYVYKVYEDETKPTEYQMELYPPSTFLGDLLKNIREYNHRQCQPEQPAQRDMSDGLDSLEECLDEWDGTLREMCRKADPTVYEIRSLIEDGVKQLILTGAPGTGKTRAAGLAAQYMGTSLAEYAVDPLVQFHPSYDYTDFVEGLRPVQLEGQKDEAARFVKVDGSFKAFCRSVAQANQVHTQSPENDPNRRYFFLIDEINRADLSKVFGELMFCLEADKRGRPVQTQYRNLPTYESGETGKFRPMEDDIFAKGFFIPKNVIIIGTMNDIDRSVESMDFALRRRFEFHEVEVTEASLISAFSSGELGECLKKNAGEAAERVMALNKVISDSGQNGGGQFGLNSQYYISQGQFAHLPERKLESLDKLMQYVWDRRISHLLEEYVRGEDDVEAFLDQCALALKVQRAKP